MIDTFRIATLLENRVDGSFDVCVERRTFKEKEDAESSIKNTEGRSIRGQICFPDEREYGEIVMDFGFTYKATETVGKSGDGEYCFVRYGKQMDTIPYAFVEYFSRV